MDPELLNPTVVEIYQRDVLARRRFLVKRIQDLCQSVVLDVAQKKKPKLEYDDGRDSGWNSCTNESSAGCDRRFKRLVFSATRNRQKFAVIFRVIDDAYQNLVKHSDRTEDDFYCTKRALFYKFKNEVVKRFVKTQQKVEWAINQVTLLLDCGPWELGYISTSKGLIAGDLTLYLNNPNRVIQYNKQDYGAVPDVVSNVVRVYTTADYVLVIEKDSVFQKLLREDCCNHNNCILVTGKGYPDIPTRMFVNLMSTKAQIPVYALVDSNPYGFEIMCVYRFGTLNNLGYREHLLCRDMKWLGVHQSDLIKLNITRVKLTTRDLKKIRNLQLRSYIDTKFNQQLMEMRLGKAEIESVNVPVNNFLSRCFIPMKIQHKKYY